MRSGVGRGLAALAEDETAAAALGVDTRRAKVKVFILSAVLASVAGSLFAHCYAFVSPDSFNIFVSVDFVIMVVVGGMGSIWGTLFGTALITLLPEWIEALESFKDIIHGLILVLILLFLPQGLVTGIVDAVRTRIALSRIMLELHKVSKWFGGLPALQDVSFCMDPGRITALIGPNGAGKSTLINCISGVDRAQSGSILLAQRTRLKHCRPMKLPLWALPAPSRT